MISRKSCACEGIYFLLLFLLAFPAAAQLPNAWQITDPPGSNGSGLHYTRILSEAEHNAATSSGFRYSINARFVENWDSKTMVMAYGFGTERYLILFGLDPAGDLTAELEGGATFTLTTNGTGTALYHTHEIVYDPDAGTASYLFDGQTKKSDWEPSDPDFPAGKIQWGEGSTAGKGQMNFHSVRFEIVGTGVVASYDAGTEGDPDEAPDPETQGWSRGGIAGFADSISPDNAPLPTAPVISTAAATHVEQRQATLSAEIDQGNLAATAWFEWGTDTNYGSSTVPQALLSDTNLFNLSETLTGLTKGETYHFRSVATNLLGIAYGEDRTFTTPEQIVVTTLADSGPGSLRQAIADSVAGDAIAFDTFPADSTITLTSGELLVPHNLNIVGPGPQTLAISGNSSSRVFNIAAGSTVDISGMTIKNGKRPNGGTGAGGGAGGGVYNFGVLTLSNCIVTNNLAGIGGGGSSPTTGGGGTGGAGGNGGGIYNAASGHLTLIDCTVANNRAGDGGKGGKGGDGVSIGSPNGATGGIGGRGGWGGGIYNDSGSVNLIACTFNRNFSGNAGDGGAGGDGLFLGDGGPGGSGGAGGHGGGTYNNAGSLSLVSCTFYSNWSGGGGDGGSGGTAGTGGSNGGSGGGGTGGNGGGSYNNGDGITLINCTFSSNSGGSPGYGTPVGIFGAGGGIYNLGTLTSTNSILAGSIFGAVSGMNNYTNSNPQLSDLGNYGGLTQTLSPRPGSPVIDAGDDSVTDFLATDQRGYARLAGAHVDIGAMEYIPSVVVTTNVDSGPGSLREAIQVVGWDGVITFSDDLHGQTITLTSGELRIEHDLNIVGPGPENLSIDGDGKFRIFEIDEQVYEVTVDSLTLAGGNTSASGGGIFVHPRAGLVVGNSDLVGNSAGSGAAVYGAPESRLTLNNSTLTDNTATTNGGGIYAEGYLTLNSSTLLGNSASEGGGIYVGDEFGGGGGSIALTNTVLSGNVATNGDGGGIHITDYTTVRLEFSTLSGNTATTNGGGIYNDKGSLQLMNSLLSDNSAGDGGGIYSRNAYSTFTNTTLVGNVATLGNGGGFYSSGFDDYFTLETSTLSGNTAVTSGGGVFITNSANLTLKNSTISGNSAGSGGGIYNAGDYAHVRLEHSTLSENQAVNNGGGIYQNSSDGSSLYIANTIVAGNVAVTSPDIHAENSDRFSASGNNLTNGIPLLSPLGDYGGPTQTMPPMFGSPAIDTGADYYTNFFATDQRGYPRLSGDHVDIGAVEAQGAFANNPPELASPMVSGTGVVTLNVTDVPNLDLTVLTSTNLALPLIQWIPIGLMSQSDPGEYLFIDPQSTNYPVRFYQTIAP